MKKESSADILSKKNEEENIKECVIDLRLLILQYGGTESLVRSQIVTGIWDKTERNYWRQSLRKQLKFPNRVTNTDIILWKIDSALTLWTRLSPKEKKKGTKQEKKPDAERHYSAQGQCPQKTAHAVAHAVVNTTK